MVRVAAIALALQATACVAASVTQTATVDTSLPALVGVIAVALGTAWIVTGSERARRVPRNMALEVALVWLSVGAVQHYLLGIEPQWAGRPVIGVGHLVWDAGFHLPALLLTAFAWLRSSARMPPTNPSEASTERR